MNAAQTGHRLPCGHTVEEVWDDMEADRITAHELDCTHCATARVSLAQLSEATRFLIDDPVELPAGLLGKIMTAVRADLTLGQTLALPARAAHVDISLYALAAVLRYVVDGVDGVRAHHCRIEPVVGEPAAVTVWISVALRFGSGRVGALDEVRRRVAAALSDRIGVDLAALDFEVVDVWIDDARPAELS